MSTLYHHTTQMHLPRILRDGKLRPLVIRDKTREYYRRSSRWRNDGDAPDFVHATTNAERERTATVDMPDANGDGSMQDKIVRVRFTLHAEDFEPWREVVARYPSWTPELIRGHEKVGRQRGSDIRSWYARAEPLKCDRWVAIHHKRPGDDQWLPCPMDATIFSAGPRENAPLMGVALSDGVHWSKHFVDDETGLDAYAPTYITDTAKTLAAVEAEPLTESLIRKLAAPAPKLAILADPYADPAEFIKPKAAPLPATPNAQRMTTSVRYVITEDTFQRYPREDIEAEKAELIAAGLWKLPSDEPFTIRIDTYELAECLGRISLIGADSLARWRTAREVDVIGIGLFKEFVDLDFRGGELVCASRVFAQQVRGNPDKRWLVENPSSVTDELCKDIDADPASRQAWWEKGNWLFHRFVVLSTEDDMQRIGESLLDILVLALMDKSIVRERTPRPVLSSAFQPGGWLYSKELDVQEVTIRCPGFYRERGESGEPTGRKVKMHRRRGHIRTYHRGLPNEFTGYIDPVWINVIAGVEPPPVVYTVRAS
jgi:hypothetical protein